MIIDYTKIKWDLPIAGLSPLLPYHFEKPLPMQTFDATEDQDPPLVRIKKQIEAAGWHLITVPAARAGDAQEGIDRASWCAENFGPCALAKNGDGHPFALSYDESKDWAALRCHRTFDQLFYFKDDRHATLFRICRG
jgi:hypothetical protein